MPKRKISRCPAELSNILFDIAGKFNMKNIEYTLTLGYEDIESYVDGIYKVCIRGERDGQRVKKILVVKWHSDRDKRSDFSAAYQREYFFHCHIVPKYVKLQRTFKVIEGLKIKFLNCILATAERGKEAIVFSDPIEDRFMFRDRFHMLDLDHVALAVKNLAKLHALSFVLEKSQPEEFEEIKETCHTDVQYSDAERTSKCIASYFKSSVDVVADTTSHKKLQECAPRIHTILNSCVMPKSTHKAICHGDYWTNNILFKYQNKRPVDTIFIDNQLVRYASPVTDLSYFLYLSTDQEFRIKHYNRVLSLYYGTLTAVIRQYNLDIDEIYPENIFRDHLRKYSVYGLIEALISMKIITAVPEEALKMADMRYCLSEDDSCGDELQNHKLFVERVNGVVEDFFANDYLLDAVLS